MPGPTGKIISSVPASQYNPESNSNGPKGKLVSSISVHDFKTDELPEEVYTGYNESEINNLSEANDDEKAWLKQTRSLIGQKLSDGEVFTPEKWEEAKKTLNKDVSIYGEDVFGGPKSTTYYWDKNGLPKALKLGEKLPVDAKIEGIWGNFISSQDDSAFTTTTKAFYNSALDVLKAIPSVINTGYGLLTGNDADWTTATMNSIDRLKFSKKEPGGLIKSDMPNFAEATVADVFNPENWNINAQSVGNFTGSLLGYVAQFFIAGKALGSSTGSTAAQQFIKGASVSSALSLNEALKQTEAAGIEGRDKYALAATSAIGTGILEMAIGGFEMRALGAAGKKELAGNISREMINSFVSSGKKLTAESLETAFKESLKKGSSVIPDLLKEAGKEASEEALQTYYQTAVQEIYDKTVENKFNADITGAKTFADALEGSIGGALMGGFGNVRNPNLQSRQAQNIFQAIKSGQDNELIKQFHNMVQDGEMTPNDYNEAVNKVREFKGYISKIKDLNISDEGKARAAQIIYEDDNLLSKINDLQKGPNAENIQTKAEIKIMEAQRSSHLDELTNIYAGKWEPGKQNQQAEQTQENIVPGEQNVPEQEFTESVNTSNENIVPEQQVQTVQQAEQSEPTKIKDFSTFVTDKLQGREFNSRQVSDSERNFITAEYLRTIPSKTMSGGSIELPAYAATSKFGIHYVAKFGDKKIKFASRYFTKGHGKQELTAIPIEAKLVEPTDENLTKEQKQAIVQKEDGTKVFKFPGVKNEYKHLIEVRNQTNGDVIARLRYSDLFEKQEGAGLRHEYEPTQATMEKPEFSIKVGDNTYNFSRQQVSDAQGNVTNSGPISVTDAKGISVSASERKMAIKRYAKAFKFDNGKRIEYIPQGFSNEEVYDYIATESNNPMEIVETYQMAKAEALPAQTDYNEYIISQYLNKITRESFIRHDDRNNITSQIAKTYFSDNGMTLDQVALEVSEVAGREVTPEDVADFIKKYPNKTSYSKATQKSEPGYMSSLKGRFEKLTGIELNEGTMEIALNQQIEKNNLQDVELYLEPTQYEPEQAIADYQKELEDAFGYESEESSVINRLPKDERQIPERFDEGETKLIPPDIYEQKTSVAKKESIASRNKKVERLKKALLGVEVVIDDTISGAGQVDADGKTLRLNPNYNYSDTPIHEFGHVLIDVTGGVNNELNAKGIEQLRDTELWNRVKENYPELNDEMLAKEVLATAIGEEGAILFENEEKQSAFSKWLNDFFNAIKSLLGIEESVAKQLARQLLSGNEITSETKASGKVQFQKKKELRAFSKIKPMSFSKFAQQTGIDVGFIQERIQEINEELIDPDSDQEQLNNELADIKGTLSDVKAIYDEYVTDRINILELVDSMGDISKMSLTDLVNTVGMLSKFDDIKNTAEYRDLMFNIGQRVNALQIGKLKENSLFDPEDANIGDLTQSDVFMQGLSTISERFPAIQGIYKMYQQSYRDMTEDVVNVQKEADVLAKKVISEYHKSHGIIDRLKNFVTGAGHKYFSYMAKNGKLISKEDHDYAKLSQAQKDLLDYVTEKTEEFAQYSGIDGDVVLRSKAGFIESFQKDGLLKSYANWLSKSYNLREVKVEFKNPETKKVSYEYFGDVENILNEYGKKSVASKAVAATLLSKYNLQARNLLSKKVDAEGNEISLKSGGGRFYLTKDKKLISKNIGIKSGDFSEDYYSSFMQYINDAAFSKHMSPIIPLYEGVEAFYRGLGNKENVLKFLDIAKKGKFLGKIQETGAGAGFDSFLGLLRKWTSWRYIAFNIPLSGWNIFMGKYNTFRSDGAKVFARGEKRFFTGVGNKNKAINILKNYLPTSLYDPRDIDPEKHVGRLFSLVSFGGLQFGEKYVRNAAIIGKISPEHYAWFDNNGKVRGLDKEEVKSREEIIKQELLKYSSEVDSAQGRYTEMEKRNFGYMTLGQSLSQFKVWIPEWISERFANRYIDANGVERQGTLRTLFQYGIKDLAKDVLTKEFYTSNDVRHVNMRKNFRGAMTMGAMILLYLSASDDKEDKEMAGVLGKAMKDVAGIYNMSSASFIISQPMASLSVAADFTNALQNAFLLAEKKNGALKAPGMFLKLIPGNKMVEQTGELLSGE